jgi:uncharacterized protein
MSEQDIQTVKSGYDAFNRGDIPGVLATYQDDIEWIEPGGGNAPSGTFHGTGEVEQQVFGSVPQNFGESFSCEPDDLREEGDRVIVTGRFKGKHTSGADLDAEFEHVATMRDGKIARFENKPDTEAWSKGWGG